MDDARRAQPHDRGTSRRWFLQQATALAVGGPMVAVLDRTEVAAALARAQTEATPVAGDGVLPSWRPGERREAMLAFVDAVTDESGADYVAPAERFATFDLDGTLMVSHPMYAEIVFTVDRVQALAADHPAWQTTEPYRTLLSEPIDQMWKVNQQEAQQALADLHAGLTVDEFMAVVREWGATNQHPKFDRPQTELIYQPMLEVIDYLHQHDFACYIVSGSGQEFIRSFSPANIGIPPERVVGTAMVPKFVNGGTEPRLELTSEVLYVDDSGGKPEGINLVIGHRPLAAFGNSDGDVQMLEYTGAGAGARLMMIVHHDDAEREYAYDVDTEVGRLSQATMDLAHEKGWHLISMKDDWTTIF